MITYIIILLLTAIAVPSIKSQINSVSIIRITLLTFIYAIVLTLHTIDILSLGSGMGLFNGLFTVTITNQIFDVFLLSIALFILLSLPLKHLYL